ncbi:MAG: transcription termination factor NusA [Planctomycetes bacterium]|nr:transcription termination factor NusA [Planctomycetota bacterium]
MANHAEILRYIDSIARDKEIDKEGLIAGIEQAMSHALAKKYGVDDVEIMLDRETGEFVCNYEVSMEEQGRIFAMSVKQAIISRVREAERDVIYAEYEAKLGEIVSGNIQRFEGDTVIVNLGRNLEGILPRSEKVRSENYNVGERIRALVYEVKKVGPRVKVILSRTHRDLVRALFELEVPEIADGTIMIRRIEREPGYRTKLAVDSSDDKVDCVGACVGVRGNRIKSIIDELNGERIDIIRWNNEPMLLIANALKPAEVGDITLDPDVKKALVIVGEDQQSLAIGRKGQNVRLASKLTGWDIDIMTRAELEQSVAEEDAVTTVDTGDAEEPVDVDVPAEAGESTTDAPTDAAPADAAPADAAATDDAAAAPATDGATPAEADTAAEAPAEPPAATERPEDGAAGSPQ